jgi:hypothetical protein
LEHVGLARGVLATFVTEAIARAATLWQQLAPSDQRDIDEFELAILLTALAEAGCWEIDEMLREAEASSLEATAWVRGLASHLRKRLHAGHYAQLGEQMEDWLARPHNDVPSFEPDMLPRAQVDAA